MHLELKVAVRMSYYSPSTKYRYLDLPSTQIIQTHNTHRHNTTQPSQTRVQAAPHSPPTPPNPPKLGSKLLPTPLQHHPQHPHHRKQNTYPTFQMFLQYWQSPNPILSTYDMTTYYTKTDRHSPTSRKLTGHNSRKTQSTLSLRPPYNVHTNIHTVNIIFTNIVLMADKHNIPKGKMHSNCMLLLKDIVIIIFI